MTTPTIPATPAATSSLLPVRYVLVCNRPTSRGDYPTGYAWAGAMVGSVTDTDSMYTLLPPHLAEKWAELREALRVASSKLYMDAMLDGNNANVTRSKLNGWHDAWQALADFEKANGIGGGA